MNGRSQDNSEPDFVAYASALLLSLKRCSAKKRIEKCNFKKDKYFALKLSRMMNEYSFKKNSCKLQFFYDLLTKK